MIDIGEIWTNKIFADYLVAITIAFISGVLSPIVAGWAKEKFSRKKCAFRRRGD